MANNRRRTKPTSVNYSQFPSGYEEGLQKLAAERAKSRFTDFTQLSPRIDPVYDEIEFEYENQNINDNLEGSPAKPFFGIGGRTARVKGETNPRFVYFPELADDGTPQKDGAYRNTNMHIRIQDNAVYLPSIGAYVNKDSNGNTFVLGQDGTPKAPLRDIKMPIPTSEVAMFSKLKAGGIEDARPDLVKMPEQVDPNYDENFFLGNAKAIAGGAQHLYYTGKAFTGALTGDADMVMEATKGMSGVAQSQEQRRLQEDVQRRLGSEEYQKSLGFWGGVYNGIKAWSAQVIENPNGLFDTILGMAPMGVAIGLTGGAAGAAAGAGAAAAGLGATAAAAAVGTAQVATMYGANTILTGGMKSIEAASDGSYNKQEGYDALKKGAIKSVPYVAVDLLTMGVASRVLSMPARAMERAAFKILTKNGINPSEVEAGINSVRQSVLAKHANLENTPANRSVIQADMELSIANYLGQSKLATPELIQSTQEAMKLALNNSNRIMSKLPRAAIRYGSTSLLMGAGEYAGELAAEGHASPSMAVEVAFTGLGMTVAHVKLAERYARLKGKIQGIDTPKDAPIFNNELAARLYYGRSESTAVPTPTARTAGSEETPTAPTPTDSGVPTGEMPVGQSPESIPTVNLDPNSITVTTDNSGIPVIKGLGNEPFQESLNRANVLSFRILEQDRLARQVLSEAEGKPMSYQQELMYNDHIKTRDYLTEQLKPINEMLIRNNPEVYKGDTLDAESTRAYVEEKQKLIDTRYAEIEKRRQDVLKGRDEVDPSLTPDELKQIERINVEEGFVNADSQALRQIHGEVMDSISQDPAPKVPRITPEERSLAIMNLNRSFYGSGTVGNEGRPLVVRAATQSEITQGVPNSKLVSAIGDALGVNLVYTKGGKGVFEGVYSPDAKRVVFLDVDSNGKTPALNVLFHEFAHSLEKSPESRRTYERIKSQIFEKDGDGNFIHIEKDAYDRFVEKTALIEQNARGIDREQALRIAEAEVVSEVLGSASNTEAFIKTLSEGDAKKFKGFIQEFVDYIKEVVTTVKERYGKTEGELMTKDLDALAEKLAKIISEDGTGRSEGDGQGGNEILFSRTEQEDNAKKLMGETLGEDYVLVVRKNPESIPDSVLQDQKPMDIKNPLPKDADSFLRGLLEKTIKAAKITDPVLIKAMMNSDLVNSDLTKRALMLPQKVGRYWYENSAKAFKNILKLSYEDTETFFRVLSGTSGGQKPYQNTKLALAAMSQWVNNKPVTIGLRDTGSLAKALGSDGLTSLKFGNFADTFLRLSGISKIIDIISTIDTQMAQMAGNKSTEGPSAAQYEAISRYLLEVRDHLNKQMAEEQGIPVSELKEPLEAHQLQAMLWVEYRAQKEGTSSLSSKDGKYDDYASVLPRIIQELKDAGIPLSEDGKITRETLSPELVEYVQEKSESTKGPVMTTEINSESVDRLTGASFVRKALNLLPEEVRQRANQQYTEIITSNLNRLIKKTDKVSPLSRLLTYVVGDDSAEFTRAALGQGTYEGKVSPNLRFPLSDLITKFLVFDKDGNAIKKTDGKYETRPVSINEMLAFMSEIGRTLQQESNATSMFADRGTLDRAVYEAAKVEFEGIATITIDDAFTFYIKGGLEAMSPDVIASLGEKIGLPINYSQSAAGHVFDFVPVSWAKGKNNAENIKSAFKELGIDGTIIERDYVGFYIEEVNYDAAIKQQQAISRRNSRSAKEGSRQQNAFGRVGVYSQTLSPPKTKTSQKAINYNKYIKPLIDLVDNKLTPELTEWSNKWNKEVEKAQKAKPLPKPDLSYKRTDGETRLHVDVPNEEWLQGKIDTAKKRGRNRFGAPHFGNHTSYFEGEPLRISLDILSKLRGTMGEQQNVRVESLKYIKDTMKKTGKMPTDGKGIENLPFIGVAYDGVPWVWEGNHRIMAAKDLGFKDLPVEIMYFDGGERIESGPLYPKKILSKETLDTDLSYKRPEEAVKSEKFMKWFEGSKVVDQETGLPKVVYHGTNEVFKNFDSGPKERTGKSYGKGSYFTTNPQEAGTYSSKNQGAVRASEEGANIVPAYLNIKNPFEIRGENGIAKALKNGKINYDFAKQYAIERLLVKNRFGENLKNRGSNSYADDGIIFSLAEKLKATKEFNKSENELIAEAMEDFSFMDNSILGRLDYDAQQRVFKAGGFDGIHITSADTPQSWWVSFDPNQISNMITGKVMSKDVEGGAMFKRPDGTPDGTIERIPELEEAIKQRKSGDITQEQFNETVSRLAPIYTYKEVPEIVSYEEIKQVVNSAQSEKVGKPIGEDGKPIRTRVDIPSYVRSGTHVVAIHEPKGNAIVSYEPFIALDGPITFGIDKEASIKIGAGDKSKYPMAFIDGNYRSLTQDQIRLMAEDAMSKPDEWRQVGVDPRRHGFAYDRETQDPIVGADEVIQIGGLVLAKGVKYATPEQRKSLYYKRVEKEPKFNPFKSAEDRETIIYNVSDSFVDIKRLVQAAKNEGQKYTYENDPDANLVQSPAKARFENNKFRERFAKSLFEVTKKHDVTEKDLSEFMHYDHATERNIQTQSIGRKSNRLEDGGSGLTEKEIRQYFNTLPENKRDALSKAAKEMRKFDEETLKLKYTYGLITDTDYANILQAYKKHVPLMRIEPEEMIRDLRAGKARTGTETTTQRAKGSELEVSDVINNIMADREHAINLIHKNRINKSVWNFLNLQAKRGVNTSDFGVVLDPSSMTESDIMKMTTQLDKYGLTESEISSVLSSLQSEAIDARDAVPFRRPSIALQAKNVLFVRDGNKFKYVVFNPLSKPAMRFAEQLKILTPADPSKFVDGMNRVTRVFTGWNTTLDPTFPVRNFILDSTGMVLNLSDTPLNNKVGAVYKNMPSAIKEIWSYSMDKAKRVKGKPLTEVQKFYEELMESGGTHHWNEVLETAEKRTKYLAEEIKALERGENLDILEFTKAVHEANQDASENAGRLSVYMEMRKLGYTKDESANVAKKISIDFDTSGAATRKANKFYAFLSASVGGQSRTLKAIASERGKKVVGGLVGLGVLQAFMLAAAGLDDEIPEWEQRNNFIIPTGGKTYMKIKVRGLSSFLNIGRVSTQLAMGGVINKGEKVSGIFSSFREMLDPFGQTGSLLQTLTPTILRPAVGAMENKNWTGEKLFNEKFTDEDVNPAYARARRKTSAASVALSAFLNNYSGGSPYSSGLIDIPPEVFDSLVSSYGGGYGRIASQVKRSAEEGRVTALPVIREVAGAGKPEQMNTTYFYDIVEKINEIDKGLRGYAEDRDTRGLARFKANNPNYKLVEGFKEDIKDIRAIDKKAKMAKSDEEKNQLEKKSNKLKAELVEKYRKKML